MYICNSCIDSVGKSAQYNAEYFVAKFPAIILDLLEYQRGVQNFPVFYSSICIDLLDFIALSEIFFKSCYFSCVEPLLTYLRYFCTS